jgi:hypothetical protein
MRNLRVLLSLLFLSGCAGVQRSCAVFKAEAAGSNWIIVQLDYQGHPFNCWKLSNTSVTNEGQSDGIYWFGTGGHLVHIGGWYDRVQVSDGDYDAAALAVGVNAEACGEGRYPAAVQ